MEVGGALLDREPEELVHGSHDRRAAGEIAQIVEIVVGGSRRLRRAGEARLLELEARDQRRLDVVGGRDRDGDGPLQRQLDGADRLAVGRVATARVRVPEEVSYGKSRRSRRKRGESSVPRKRLATRSPRLTRSQP